MFIRDLDLCTYHSGPFDAKNWSVPLLAVGWLQFPNPYVKGEVSIELISKLEEMVQQTRAAYFHCVFRGAMDCTFCKSVGGIWSQENLFVPGNDAVYVAHGGIVHYVRDHSYSPPLEFIDAALRCSDCQTDEYQRELIRANQGREPPLETEKQFQDSINMRVKHLQGRTQTKAAS
jgi:hypothetical protein